MNSEYLDESTHVRSLELPWQIHGEGERRNRVLFCIGSIKNNDRILEITDTDLVDGKVPLVTVILDVLHRLIGLSSVDATGCACLPYDDPRELRECAL